MSSPFTYGEPSPRYVPAAVDDQDEDPAAGIQKRVMRVKVLYTFDDSHKTYCLARLPNALNIPTVLVDDDTQVGVIELRTCVEALVSSSPELVARLGQDYTVYAYDYSEYETPLVGQGMLSWILSTASSNSDAPSNTQKTMVTGKVRENILGLFSGGIKETLEVKLKLVPVPTFLQSDYIETMEKYRSLGQSLPEGFDHSAWMNFLKTNPDINTITAHLQSTPFPQSMALQRVNPGGVESLHQMLSQNASPHEERRGSQLPAQPMSQSRQGSRACSPATSVRSAVAFQQPPRDHSRPTSSASHTSERPFSQPSFAQPASDPSYGQNRNQELEHEECPPRKRARVVQADWRGKSQFGPKADTLRITASTAASVRVHKPTPIHMTTEGLGDSLEPPQRPPTPRPTDFSGARARASMNVSSLRRESSLGSLPNGQRGPCSETGMASEDDQMADAEDSPAEFPSSPPICPRNHDSPAPSSPGLPTFPCTDDSGFMSGSVLDSEAAIENRQYHRAPHPTSEAPTVIASDQWKMETPGPPEMLPTRVGRRQPHYKHQRKAEEAAAAAAARAASSDGEVVLKKAETRDATIITTQSRVSETDSITAASSPTSTTTATFSTNPTAARIDSGPAANAAPKPTKPPKQKKLPRSQTWTAGSVTGNQDGEASGPVIVPDPHSRPASPAGSVLRSGSGAKRKKAIEDRLRESLAEGKMPDFCAVCGEIKTPTWRKAFFKVVEGTPENIVTSLEETGAVAGYEVMVPGPDEENAAPKYKLYKRSLNNEDKANNDYTPMMLCNPCGLHFAKAGTMRPPERWAPKTKESKRGRPRKRAATKKDPSQEQVLEHEGAQDGQEARPAKRQRAASWQPLDGKIGLQAPQGSRTNRSLGREFCSSPPPMMGSQESPINIDEDSPSERLNTRRLLFPSPRKDGQFKSLDDGFQEKGKGNAVRTNGQKAPGQKSPPLGSGHAANAQDKENMPPPGDEDNSFAHLFEEGCNSGAVSVSATPAGRSGQDLLKTPGSKGNRAALTPKGSSARKTIADFLNLTPSKTNKTPKSNGTPFSTSFQEFFKSPGSATRNLNWLSSPGTARLLEMSEFDVDMFPTSDFPLPSSPSHANNGFNFSLYEDPMTSSNTLDNFWFTAGENGLQITNGEQGAEVDYNARLEDFTNIVDEVMRSGNDATPQEKAQTPTGEKEAQSGEVAASPENEEVALVGVEAPAKA
ncbi:hypothetical protein IWZ01DRAFT_453998 [Phyllosticta capitalensis]